LNLGATISVHVSNNVLRNNGGAGGGAEILASALDGSNAANWLGWRGQNLSIVYNKISIAHAAMVPIQATNGWEGLLIEHNEITNDYLTPSIVSYGTSGSLLRTYHNRISVSRSFKAGDVASSTTLVIPDQGNVVGVSGVATIQSILSRSTDTYKSKVCVVVPRSFPTFSSNPSLSFNGGQLNSGSPATGVVVYDANRTLIGVYITYGGDYAVAPSCVITDGNTTVIADVYLGVDNSDERIITLSFRNAAVVSSGVGNIYLSGGGSFNASQLGTSSLTLRGEFANWYEVSRSV
jgi:hypothetical protein